MPATSDKQQTAARIAHAIKKGKVKPKKGTASAQMAKGMSDKQIKHFMVKEDDGGTTSVNVGVGTSKPWGKRRKSASFASGKKDPVNVGVGSSKSPPKEKDWRDKFEKNRRDFLNKGRGTRTNIGGEWRYKSAAFKKKEEAAAFQRVMNMVYAEEARLRKIA